MRTDHRPWPAPARAWTMAQTWHDLLFAHWTVDARLLRPLLPAPLTLDTYEGRAFVGVVPFRMSGIRLRLLPPVPGAAAFPEINVRTYATHRGRPGVFFLSLDATSPLAVWTARRFFRLPYYRARITCRGEGERVVYESRRTHAGFPAVSFRGSYGPVGASFLAARGSLEHWLTERYCLYVTARDGSLQIGEIVHDPWPLQSAEARIEWNDMASPHGLDLDGPPLLHFSRRIDVRLWGLDGAGA